MNSAIPQSCGIRLDWDFVVDSEHISLGSFSGILSFYMGTALSLFLRILVPQVILATKYFCSRSHARVNFVFLGMHVHVQILGC